MMLDDLLTNCRQLVTQRMKSPFILQQCDSIVSQSLGHCLTETSRAQTQAVAHCPLSSDAFTVRDQYHNVDHELHEHTRFTQQLSQNRKSDERIGQGFPSITASTGGLSWWEALPFGTRANPPRGEGKSNELPRPVAWLFAVGG